MPLHSLLEYAADVILRLGAPIRDDEAAAELSSLNASLADIAQAADVRAGLVQAIVTGLQFCFHRLEVRGRKGVDGREQDGASRGERFRGPPLLNGKGCSPFQQESFLWGITNVHLRPIPRHGMALFLSLLASPCKHALSSCVIPSMAVRHQRGIKRHI